MANVIEIVEDNTSKPGIASIYVYWNLTRQCSLDKGFDVGYYMIEHHGVPKLQRKPSKLAFNK